MSNTENAFLIVNNSGAVTVSETKSFNLYLRTYIPFWEDVNVSWTITGDNLTTISGTGVFRASTGQKGTYRDTIKIDVPSSALTGTALSSDATLTFTATTASGKTVDAGYNGDKDELSVTVNKYVPLDRSVFIGLYTEDDGSGPYTNVSVTEDPDDEFSLIIATKIWGDVGSYKVTFNTIDGTVSVSSPQFIGMDYPGQPSTDPNSDYAIWFYPASSCNGATNR